MRQCRKSIGRGGQWRDSRRGRGVICHRADPQRGYPILTGTVSICRLSMALFTSKGSMVSADEMETAGTFSDDYAINVPRSYRRITRSSRRALPVCKLPRSTMASATKLARVRSPMKHAVVNGGCQLTRSTTKRTTWGAGQTPSVVAP